jgi:Amt family ammonium transporter
VTAARVGRCYWTLIERAVRWFMKGVESTWTESGPVAPLFPALTIPYLRHMLFQGMFFIITPALIVGSFAERMKFSTMVVFTIL